MLLVWHRLLEGHLEPLEDREHWKRKRWRIWRNCDNSRWVFRNMRVNILIFCALLSSQTLNESLLNTRALRFETYGETMAPGIGPRHSKAVVKMVAIVRANAKCTSRIQQKGNHCHEWPRGMIANLGILDDPELGYVWGPWWKCLSFTKSGMGWPQEIERLGTPEEAYTLLT